MICAWCGGPIYTDWTCTYGPYKELKIPKSKWVHPKSCGENTGHYFHPNCKILYVDWLKTKPWGYVDDGK